jgi:hypothetical protein
MYKNALSRFGHQSASSDDQAILKELHKTPVKENRFEMPIFQDFKPDFTNQIDTLYLPTAKGGYKYLLVCVDNHTRHFDAEPMKQRSATDALRAIKKIYERMHIPKRIEVDAGVEFQGTFKKYFEDKNIMVRVAAINRHRQQALVEGRNNVLGKVIFMLMDSKEMKTGKTSKDWYKSGKEFRELIDFINDHIKYKPQTIQEASRESFRVDDSNRDVLPQGSNVRIALDYPISVASDKRIGSTFRATDIRWSKDVKKIDWNVFIPNQPPMYKVNGIKHLFTRQQLQPSKFV